jgi:hypothetical protein
MMMHLGSASAYACVWGGWLMRPLHAVVLALVTRGRWG